AQPVAAQTRHLSDERSFRYRHLRRQSARSPQTRLQYFHPSRRMGWDLKLNALVDAIHDFDVHVVKNEPESLLLEGRLIKEFHPRYNVSFRDDKRFLLLKINLNDPIPRFTLTRL